MSYIYSYNGGLVMLTENSEKIKNLKNRISDLRGFV